MQIEQQQYDVGVIVGRFQVPVLHEAHLDLINSVRERHDKVLIFLGVSPLWSTYNNPLDFEARKQMLLHVFPDINVLYIKDTFSDDLWSKNLDRMIEDVITPNQSVVLYGSRDSFIPHYTGKLDTRTLEPTAIISGTEARKAIVRSSTKASADFRAGAIWAAGARFPTLYTTVDVAILNETGQEVLLGRKHGEDNYRFIGGFTDPTCDTMEFDVQREAFEEAHARLGKIRYLGSRPIDDWRYRSERDKVRTCFFVAHIAPALPGDGHLRPGDDIDELRWFPIHGLQDHLIDAHKDLGGLLWEHFVKTAGREA